MRTTLALAAAVVACESRPQASVPEACPVAATGLVEQLGVRMRLVSLLAPDSVLARELDDAYTGLVAKNLLDEWTRNPSSAPGRDVSSPWPARITVRDRHGGGKTCTVTGDLIYVANLDTMSAVSTRPLTVVLTNDRGWRITSYEATGSASASPSPISRDTSGPVAVITAFYDTAQFDSVLRVRAKVTDSVHLEGAAGSQYATVPVEIEVTMTNGTARRCTLRYTLRRSMVDGATPEQRTWRIYTVSDSAGRAQRAERLRACEA